MSNTHILICIFLLNVLATSGLGVIIEPKYKERHEGDDVKFMWNSTSGQIITSATFGLSKDGLPNPQFINVNILTGQVNTNNETDNRFAGRVYFIGNLTAGHAWFVIRNLEINDTNKYIARISVGGSTTESYVVQLVVQRSSDKGQKDHSDSYLRTYDSNFERETLITCGSKPFKYSYVGGEGFKDDYYLNSTKKDPSVKKVPTGTNFTYECSTINKDTFRIYKYGLFEKGFPAPSKLICRVEVEEQSGFCTVKWAKEKSSSRYFGRISVKYNRETHSMIWTLHNVSHGDENTFIAIFKDNFAPGQGFKECLPVILQVTAKATVRSTPTPPTPSATSYKRQTKRTDEKEYKTEPKITTIPSDNRNNKNVTAFVIAGITAVLVALILSFIIVCVCVDSKKGLKRNFPLSETEKSLMSKPKNPEKSDPV